MNSICERDTRVPMTKDMRGFVGKTVGVSGQSEVQISVHIFSGMLREFRYRPDGMELFSVTAERSAVANAASLLARRFYYVWGSVAVPQKCRLAYMGE